MKIALRLRLPLLCALACGVGVWPAGARDSAHYACVGHVNIGDSASLPDSKGVQKIAMTYDDQRAGKMGEKRRVTITMSMDFGNRTGVSDQVTDSAVNKIVIRNDEDKNDMLFRGTVQLVDDAENLLVNGEFTSNDKKVHHVHVKLACYEVAGIWYGQNIKRIE